MTRVTRSIKPTREPTHERAAPLAGIGGGPVPVRLGVTGTDTGVGKTLVACGIAASLRAAGARVAVMKPVETGGSDDAERLREAAGARHPLRLVRPAAYDDPAAPLVAARRARRPVDLEMLDRAHAELSRDSDAVVVEGAGGLLVPITESESYATLFQRWGLELVIVAANRLGVINHTLLTVAAARSHGLVVRAVVLNTAAAGFAGVAERTNEAVLKELLRSVPVVSLPFLPPPHDADRLAAAVRQLRPHLITRPA